MTFSLTNFWYGFISYSPLQRNPFFCILPYKMAMFTFEKKHLNIVEKLSFCHHLFVLMWGVSQWVLAAKFSAVSKLFNFENCVILAHIRFNLKLSSLDIFESFDSASGSWLSDLSNDLSFFNFDYSQSYARFSNVGKKRISLQATVHICILNWSYLIFEK